MTNKTITTACKKAYNLAMSSDTKRVYEKMDSFIEKFPEITKNESGYVVTTIGEFLKRNNAPEWQIKNAIRNKEYDKKGIFGIICVQLGINNFTGEPILSDPKLAYIK